MKKSIQFNKLSREERVRVLVMAAQTDAFESLVVDACEKDADCCLRWVIEQTAEHFTHMNTISGGKYGESTELDV